MTPTAINQRARLLDHSYILYFKGFFYFNLNWLSVFLYLLYLALEVDKHSIFYMLTLFSDRDLQLGISVGPFSARRL